MSPHTPLRITLIGAGTIGLSFAVLHLSTSNDTIVTICDPRPDLHEYVSRELPKLIAGVERLADFESLTTSSRLLFNPDLASAVSNAEIIQEQGPENPAFKQKVWQDVELHAPATSLLWSSTSGIPASVQSSLMTSKDRLIVVHPYNPPHVMPLIEVVPTPLTAPDVTERTVKYWESIGRAPVVIKKEVTGFVANRLALALLREAIYLVDQGVVTVEELDTIVVSSMGPRWAKAGPFKSYNAGGGAGGFEGLMKNIGGTIQACWDDAGKVNFGDGWEEKIYAETKRVYGDMNKKN